MDEDEDEDDWTDRLLPYTLPRDTSVRLGQPNYLMYCHRNNPEIRNSREAQQRGVSNFGFVHQGMAAWPGSIVSNLCIPGTWKVGYFDCLLDHAWCMFLNPTALALLPPSFRLPPRRCFPSCHPSLGWNPSPHRILILKDIQ